MHKTTFCHGRSQEPIDILGDRTIERNYIDVRADAVSETEIGSVRATSLNVLVASISARLGPVLNGASRKCWTSAAPQLNWAPRIGIHEGVLALLEDLQARASR